MTRRASHALLLAGTLTLGACSDEPLVFPDWQLPVADRTRVIGHGAIPDVDRSSEVALERDLVITEAFGRPLYEPNDVAVADDGVMFVLDRGNSRIVAFGPDGEPLYEFGAEGQGPGEFSYPRHLAMVGDILVVNDQGNSKFSLFDRDGTHLRDHRLRQPINSFEARGAGDEIVIFRYEPADEQPTDRGPPITDWIVSRHALNGDELHTALRFRGRDSVYFVKGTWQGSVPLAGPHPVGTIGRDGGAFFSTGVHYQVHAFDPEGSPKWALRVSYEPEVPSEADKRAAADILSALWDEMMPGLNITDDDIHWPVGYPAIEALRVDGHGNLYAFPFTGRGVNPRNNRSGPFPVDVYSPTGERRFAGFIGIDSWQAALGDHLYRIETDPETAEQVVARYRIVQPFQ